ncbi:MAG: sigma-70 family RNA polymerase sigma factor [Anaerovoracaceae bacterium]|nr:sigma-70 family RNA polymerase sigma factor [Anaerovoracaceae bacterium]
MSVRTKEELEAVVEKHGGLVKSVALRLARTYGEEPEDLIQIGYIGLLKAAQRFEAERGLQFSTYAVPMIAGEIRSQLRDQGSMKMSRSLKADAALVRRAESDFIKLHGLSPHLTQLAEMTGLSEERVLEACQASDALKNMQDVDGVAAETDPAMWTDREEENIARIDLASAVESLEPRARQVIVLRYYKDYTQQQVADMLGISQVQVCRIEKKTLRAMAPRVSGEL